MFSIVPILAATAAAKRRRELNMEEERMAGYTHEDLDGDWEFKIVRSSIPTFHKPQVLQRLIEQEAAAGWIMVEKFDNTRIRFKRPRSARAYDAQLPQGVDAYRTDYGTPAPAYVSMVVLGIVLLIVLAGILLVVFVSG